MTGLIAGSFDPITMGHLELIEKAAAFCDELIVMIGVNAAKTSLFSLQQRMYWLEKSIRHAKMPEHPCKIRCVIWDGIVVEKAKELGADVIIKGLRNSQDFLYEQNLAYVNEYLEKEIQTLFLLCNPSLQWVSSSVVRELLSYGKSLDGLVPEAVQKEIEKAYQKKKPV